MVIIGCDQGGMMMLMMEFMKVSIEEGIGVFCPMSDVMEEIKENLKEKRDGYKEKYRSEDTVISFGKRSLKEEVLVHGIKDAYLRKVEEVMGKDWGFPERVKITISSRVARKRTIEKIVPEKCHQEE